MSALAAIFNPRAWAIGVLLLALCAAIERPTAWVAAVCKLPSVLPRICSAVALLPWRHVAETKTRRGRNFEKSLLWKTNVAQLLTLLLAGGALERLRVEAQRRPRW